MWKIAWIFLACAIAWGADDWQKVKELKAGSDLRVYRLGSTQPLSCKMAGATDGKLAVIVKKEEIAIERANIERIDYHPPRGKGVKSESTTTTVDGYGTNTSTSSGMSWGGREGWQTVYRKTSK